MAPRLSRRRRFLLPTVLALVLAAEISGLALARTWVPVTPGPAPTSAAAADLIPGAGKSIRRADPAGATAAAPTSIERPGVAIRAPGHDATAAVRQVIVATRSSSTRSNSTLPTARPVAVTAASSRPAASIYHGVNHVWIPSLGINKGVQSFPCSRSRPPDAGVYRWGCSGHNNVYLLAHAWSTFKPLHDAYTSGRLHTGLKVVYADGTGTVRTFKVIWWKVVAPTTAAKWAWASLTTPGMTLQTCVGANSAYRLMVRLTRVA